MVRGYFDKTIYGFHEFGVFSSLFYIGHEALPVFSIGKRFGFHNTHDIMRFRIFKISYDAFRRLII